MRPEGKKNLRWLFQTCFIPTNQSLICHTEQLTVVTVCVCACVCVHVHVLYSRAFVVQADYISYLKRLRIKLESWKLGYTITVFLSWLATLYVIV